MEKRDINLSHTQYAWVADCFNTPCIHANDNDFSYACLEELHAMQESHTPFLEVIKQTGREV